MTRDSKEIRQFYLPPTHEPYLPLLPSRRASPPFGWHSLRLPTEGCPDWIDLGDWLYTEIDFPAPWVEPRGPDTVTHPSTNRARRRLTSLIETNALTTTPNRQPIDNICYLLSMIILKKLFPVKVLFSLKKVKMKKPHLTLGIHNASWQPGINNKLSCT